MASAVIATIPSSPPDPPGAGPAPAGATRNRRHLRLHGGWCGNFFHIHRESVSATRNRCDVPFLSQHFSQSRYILGEIVLLDERIRPYQLQQFRFLEHPPRPRHQDCERVEGLMRERHRFTGTQQQTLLKVDLEWPKPVDFRPGLVYTTHSELFHALTTRALISGSLDHPMHAKLAVVCRCRLWPATL